MTNAPALSAAAVIGLSLMIAGPSVAESAYGCTGLETDRELPVVEGSGGVFYRINTDLRMNHPFSDEVVAQLSDLAHALESRGTTLIYAQIPTKSTTMPDNLPPEARLYGFDLSVATRVHDDILERLNAAGVKTADIRTALLQAEPGAQPFFGPDFHWNATGADLGARAIADVIKADPAYADLETSAYTSTETGEEIAFSGMRNVMQLHCTDTLPNPVTMTYSTELAQLDLGLGGGSNALDLFGADEAQPQLFLAGTSFSDSPINNFPGFLSEHTQLEVVNYAITGGNQFGAMTSLLTSKEFQDAPPRFLVWENPIYNNLAQYGDQPMRELIAAAANQCTQSLDVALNPDGQSLQASLSGYDLSPSDTLLLDTDGSAGLEVMFRFRNASGTERQKVIARGERLRKTGRFYMPLTGLWPEGAEAVEISLSSDLGPAPTLSVCSSMSKENDT